MRCPLCNSLEDKVLESRQNSAGTSIRRRRECLSCSYRFTSYERVEEKPVMIVKKDGRREQFRMEKLERGILRALEKRPVSQTTVEDMLHRIEDTVEMQGRFTREIPSKELGDLVLQEMYRVDKVAAIRFASVYKAFETEDEFIQEIESLTLAKDSSGTSR
jgi:transcriptional repressor NrdR